MGCWDWTGEERTRWALVVDTNAYAGNFEREVCAYVAGKVDEYGEHQTEQERAAFARDYPNGNPFEDLIESRLVDPGDDGYHRSPCDVAPTPGRRNRSGSPAFNSVAIFLAREPTAEELATLKARALSFPSLPKQHEWDERPQIRGVRLVREAVRATWTSV
jgi:hypothetical protein